MSDDLLPYYLGELDHLRVAGRAFAQTHTHLAAHLDFQAAGSDDPQVARLVESFAFLTARLQRQYHSQFPEIPTALLEALYPQLVAPVPSMAIAQFTVSAKQDRAIEGVMVPRDTALFATTADNAEARFRTALPLRLWPIEVSRVALLPPGDFAFLDDRLDVETCLQVTLECIGASRHFAELRPPTLRFHVDGDRNTRFRLFELLAGHLVGIAVVRTGGALAEAVIPPGLRLRPVGLDPDEAILPYPATAHQGYRLLQEYFAFPEKFLFLELDGLDETMLGNGRTVDLLFLLDTQPAARLRVDAFSLRLGCVPIVNLFERTSEPIRLDHQTTEYRLEPDIRFADTTEIHSVVSVNRSATGKRAADIVAPYFNPDPTIGVDSPVRWLARRRPSSRPLAGGTEMLLSFVDPGLDPELPADDVLFAHVLCTNRGLARQVSTATHFQIEADLPIDDIRCLARPTAPQDPPTAGESLWRLVSHLSLNRLSLTGPGDPLLALRQLLFLHCGGGDGNRRRREIEGISRLATRAIVRRLGGSHWRGFVRGTEIDLALEGTMFTGGSAFLLGAVLDRFFALHAGINSFTETVIRRTADGEEWKRWPARAGAKALL